MTHQTVVAATFDSAYNHVLITTTDDRFTVKLSIVTQLIRSISTYTKNVANAKTSKLPYV